MLGAAPSPVAAHAVFPPTSSQTRSSPAQNFIPRATMDSLLQCVRNSPNPRKSIDYLRSKCSSLFDRKPVWEVQPVPCAISVLAPCRFASMQVGSHYDDHAIVARKKLSVRGDCSVPRPTEVVQVIPAGLPITKSSGEFAPQPHPTPTCPRAEDGDKAAVKLVPSMSQRAGQFSQPLEVANATHSSALTKVVIAPAFKVCYELEPFTGDFMFNQRILDPGGRTIYWALSQHEVVSPEHSNKHTLSDSESQHFCQVTANIYRVVKNRRGMINQFRIRELESNRGLAAKHSRLVEPSVPEIALVPIAVNNMEASVLEATEDGGNVSVAVSIKNQKTLSTSSRSADQAAAAEQPCRTQ